jgi:hypothetical protein
MADYLAFGGELSAITNAVAGDASDAMLALFMG